MKAIVAVAIALTAACGASPPAQPLAALPAEPAVTAVPEPVTPPAEPVAPVPEPAPQSPPTETRWLTQTSVNPLDDSPTVSVVLMAAEGTGGIRNREIVMIVRCQSNKTETYFEWHDYLGTERKAVTYRFPPSEASTEMWGVSTDRTATFVQEAIPFLRRLVTSERLVIQTTPYGESPSTAIFDLAGAQAALAPVAETCNWSLDPS